MATFQEAIVWLKEGKKVRRSGWTQQVYLKCRKSFGDAICYYSMDKDNSWGGKADYDFDDFEATDWEIFEEKESEGDLLKRLDIDGHKWAKEFVKIVKEKPEIPTDEGTMIGWFCNSMMAGYDRGMKDANLKEEINPKESLSDQIAKINVVGLLVPYYAYDPNYVKEKIQNAQRRLSELMEEN